MRFKLPKYGKMRRIDLISYLKRRDRRNEGLKPPAGQVFVTGLDGKILTGADGAYLTVSAQ